jgi:hypothetical protein
MRLGVYELSEFCVDFDEGRAMDSGTDISAEERQRLISMLLSLIITIAIFFSIFVWSPRQLYLAFTYGVMPNKVEIAPYPDDECSFWHVPRGWKNCEHEQLIRTVDRGGRPVAAPDSPFVDRVIVTWGEKHYH